ncbi:MAG: hypothetical protein IRY99_14050 [Isosphaeraceae bacterium]|nr:hypothetical protein [Isosphaeraceae bacterium]
MNRDAFAMIAARLDRLEQENRRLAGACRRWRGVGMAAAALLALMLFEGPHGPLRGVAQETKRTERGPLPPPPDPIRVGIGTKIIESSQYLLRDEAGNLLAVLAVHRDGLPVLSLHARNQSARLFFRVGPDGEPGIVFLDKEGRRPVELVVTREGGPRLKLVDQGDRPLFPEQHAGP